MENQQGCTLSTNQKQVLLTGYYGDGHIISGENKNASYVASSIVKPLLEFKYSLLGDLVTKEIVTVNNSGGYGENNIFKLRTKADKRITKFDSLTDEEKLSQINELGIALWFYDDGSLHKSNYFYNLCTHKYSKEYQEDLLIPKLNEFGIYPKITSEVKKDGKKFWYLRVGRHNGSFNISDILSRYPVNGMRYKVWSSETSQQWRKLLVELKSKGQVISNRAFTNELNKRLGKI